VESAQIGTGGCVADPVETHMCHHVNGNDEGLAESVHWATSADATEQSCKEYDSRVCLWIAEMSHRSPIERDVVAGILF
jgi:hypothetical protein